MPALLDQFGRELEVEARASYRAPSDWMYDWLTLGGESVAGERVSSKTALTVMAFFACVRNISEDIAKLPKKVRQKTATGYRDLPDHPVQRLLDRPSRYMNRHQFWKTYISHRCAYHGAFAYIQPTRDELLLLDPEAVMPVTAIDCAEPMYHVAGKQWDAVVTENELIHTNTLSHCGYDGYSMPQLAKQVLGAAIALQKYRGAFFGNGARPSGVLRHPAELSPEAAERLRYQFDERYAGAKNAARTLLLEQGMEWQQTSVNPDDAQAVDLTNITIEDICRIFRMPPHKIQHLARSTNNNIEHQGLEYDRDTLDPIAQELRAELEFKLLTPQELDAGIYIHINLNALMRADVATRTQYYKEMYYTGAISANDILELEDRNHVPDGNRRFIQRNLIPADRVDDVIDKEAATDAAPNAEDGMRAMLQAKIADILRYEARQAPKAKDTGAFYAKHVAHVTENMTPFIGAALTGLGIAADARTIADLYAAMHCDASLIEMQSGNWPNNERPRLNAEWLLEAVRNANA